MGLPRAERELVDLVEHPVVLGQVRKPFEVERAARQLGQADDLLQSVAHGPPAPDDPMGTASLTIACKVSGSSLVSRPWRFDQLCRAAGRRRTCWTSRSSSYSLIGVDLDWMLCFPHRARIS